MKYVSANSEERMRKAVPLDKALRIYAFFLLIVTASAGGGAAVRPRELAHILLVRYQNPKRRKRARIGGLIYLGLSLFAIPFLLRAEMRQERWLVMAVLVGMVSALEFLLNSRLFSEEALTRQNRIFGGVYASMAIAVALCSSPDDPHVRIGSHPKICHPERGAKRRVEGPL